MAEILVEELDRIEITTLVDNYSDFFLPDSAVTKRLRLAPPKGPMAEPGLSFLVTAYKDGEARTLLMDGGISPECLFHNIEVLSESAFVMTGQVNGDINTVKEAVLSHGHFDHFGGLYGFLEKYGQGMPLTLHKEAFQDRRATLTPGMTISLPSLNRETVEKTGVVLNEIDEPTPLAGGWILASGTVKRGVGFEKGSPELEAKIDDEWQTDRFHDDMALAVRVKNKGLVVIAGCSHAGVINTINHFKAVTGEDQLHAVLGGFHLGGKNVAIIEPTIDRMEKHQPEYVIPTHCTGWTAIRAFSIRMPDQFIMNSVGTTHTFGD